MTASDDSRMPSSKTPGTARRGGKSAAKTSRRRKHEAAPEDLHPDDRPTGRTLRVSEDAVRDLAAAFGLTLGTGT